MNILRKAFRIFNGSSWDEYHLKTDSKQVIHTKADGADTTVEEQLLALNSALTTNGLDITSLKKLLNNKANSSHTHDDRYYTESEIDSKLNNKSDINHRHQYLYDCKNSGHAIGISWNGSKMLFYIDNQLIREW